MKFPKINSIRKQIIQNLGNNPTEEEIQSEYDRMKSEFNKEVVIDSIKTQYKQDVFNEMLSVFGTTNIEVASANHATYEIMSKNPSDFSSEGLTDDNGLSLDTDQKIKDYADSKLLSIKNYAIYRTKRYEQYKQDLVNI